MVGFGGVLIVFSLFWGVFSGGWAFSLNISKYFLAKSLMIGLRISGSLSGLSNKKESCPLKQSIRCR